MCKRNVSMSALSERELNPSGEKKRAAVQAPAREQPSTQKDMLGGRGRGGRESVLRRVVGGGEEELVGTEGLGMGASPIAAE
jgi:hypothetical protein